MNDQYYGILDRLIKIRTEIASQLGYSSYVDMAYKKNLRCDYGEKDLVIFRKQINQLFTPVCDEIHHSNAILDVNTLFDTEPELIHAIQEMFSDISKESGNYIKDIIENGYTSSINEIHSKTMEHFAYPYLERFVGIQKKDSIRHHLYRTFYNLPYRCAIDEFEHAIYKDIDMSRKKRCEL